MAAVAVALLVTACGSGKHPSGPTPPVPPDAAPPPPLATRADCELALAHLFMLRGEDGAGVGTDDRARFVEDCAASATADDVRCVLAADSLAILEQCTPERILP